MQEALASISNIPYAGRGNPSTREVEEAGGPVQWHLNYIVSLRLAWTTADTVVRT